VALQCATCSLVSDSIHAVDTTLNKGEIGDQRSSDSGLLAVYEKGAKIFVLQIFSSAEVFFV
jgi:hypothetical protein